MTAVAELCLAWRYYGFYTGDDVEILSEAFRVATGYSYRAWDIRCLFVPDAFVAPFVWLGTRLGIHDVRSLVVLATIPSIAANAISIVLVHALAREYDAKAAPAASALFALHWISLGFASTVYPRTIATACILAAFWCVRRTGLSVVVGVLCAVAFADRFSEAVFLVPILIAARRRAHVVALSFLAAATIIVGFYDYVTWGQWFGSVRKFAALTLVESDFASRLKHQSAFWYFENIARWLSPALWPFLWIAWRRDRRHTAILWLFVLIPVAALSWVAHKELRYLQGVIPFAMLIAAIGFSAMQRRKLAIALLVIAVAWNLYGIRFLSKKTMPAVDAARAMAADKSISTVAMSQPWAYGDRLYLTEQMGIVDIGTPPRDFAPVLAHVDAVCVYDTDLTDDDRRTIRSAGFRLAHIFRDPPARDVLLFTRSSSGTSDRVRQ